MFRDIKIINSRENDNISTVTLAMENRNLTPPSLVNVKSYEPHTPGNFAASLSET